MYLVIRKYNYSSIPSSYYVAYATDNFIDAQKKKEALKELSSRESNVEIRIATLPEPTTFNNLREPDDITGDLWK